MEASLHAKQRIRTLEKGERKRSGLRQANEKRRAGSHHRGGAAGPIKERAWREKNEERRLRRKTVTARRRRPAKSRRRPKPNTERTTEQHATPRPTERKLCLHHEGTNQPNETKISHHWRERARRRDKRFES